MSKSFRHLALATVIVAASAFALQAQATVSRVVVVKADNAAAYAAEVRKGQEILKRLGSKAQLRVWRARFAGDATGTIVVTVEYPSMVVLAQDEARTATDAEYQAWLKNLGTMRKIISDSTYDEL